MTYLFIGGDHDGDWIVVERDQTVVNLAGKSSLLRQRYNRVGLVTDRQQVRHVFVLEGHQESVIDSLLARYKPA